MDDLIDYSKIKTEIIFSLSFKLVFPSDEIESEYEDWRDTHLVRFEQILSDMHNKFKIVAYMSDEYIDRFSIICDSVNDVFIGTRYIKNCLNSINYDIETINIEEF